MKRRLSSLQTFLAKFVYPGVFVIFSGFTLFNVITQKAFNDKLFFSLWFSLLYWFAFFAFVYWICIPLKSVSVDDKFLYVSNFRKEISIPLSEIHDITEIVWINVHPVKIHLKSPSEFGDKIVFMPKFRFFSFFSSHPIVDELKSLAGI